MRRRTTPLPGCPIFQSERQARAWLESRVWKNGPVCPHCGYTDQTRITQLRGRSHRPGLYQCNSPSCRRQFTITVGTIFEHSKIPLHNWLAALFLISASGARVPVIHVQRALGISYKGARSMVGRLRQALPPPVTPVGLRQATYDLLQQHLLSKTLSVDEGEHRVGPTPPMRTPTAKAETEGRRPAKATTPRQREHQPCESSEAYPHGAHRWSKMLTALNAGIDD